VTFVNRAGTMVIPFLSLYLTKGMGFTLSDVGWVMSAFGLGSVLGSYIGGQLTDRIGNYKVMTGSLFLTGILFILLQYIQGFWPMVVAVFIIMTVADAFRPAMMVAVRLYSKPENRTRAVTLIRLAINLGFTAGPALGGLIIISLGYSGLFWVDGVTCLLALVLMVIKLNPRRAKSTPAEEVVAEQMSAYKDGPFWMFFFSMVLFGFVFLQLFSTIPIYYKDIHFLSESQIGLLIGANGLIIFLIEMPLVKWLESKTNKSLWIMIFGVFLVGMSLLILNFSPWVGILWISMVLVTVGEMLVFPFSNAYALNRANRGKHGQYMALYMISFSVAHIFGHNTGMQLISRYGFEFTWNVMFMLTIVSAGLMFLLKGITKKEQDKALSKLE